MNNNEVVQPVSLTPNDCSKLMMDMASHTQQMTMPEIKRNILVSGRDEMRQFAMLRLTRSFNHVPTWSERDSIDFLLPCPLESAEPPERKFDWTFGRITQMWRVFGAGGSRVEIPAGHFNGIRRGLQAQVSGSPVDIAKWEPDEAFYDRYKFGKSESAGSENVVLAAAAGVGTTRIVLPENYLQFRTLEVSVVGEDDKVFFDIRSLGVGNNTYTRQPGAVEFQFSWDISSRTLSITSPPAGAPNISAATLKTALGQATSGEDLLVIEYCYTTGDDATHLPGEILDEYGELIWRGALRRLPDKYLVDSRGMVDSNYMRREARAVWRQQGGVGIYPGSSLIGNPTTGGRYYGNSA